jgi:ABC-type transport system involved in multi-copper enzyme maturation permease subunit
LLWLSLLVVAISFGLVEFIGELAITEHRVTQVAVLAAFLRLSAVVIVTMFVVSSSVRELQDKTLEMILAMPIHRSSYYLGKLIGFLHVSMIIALIFSVLLLLYASSDQVLIWGLSLFFELIIVVALGLVMLFTFNQIPAAISGVLVIYAAARSVTSIYLMSQYPIISHTSISQKFMDGFIETLTWLLPDLHRFTQTEWLAHNTGSFELLLPVMIQSMIYLVLLSAVALFDFYRKNF